MIKLRIKINLYSAEKELETWKIKNVGKKKY